MRYCIWARRDVQSNETRGAGARSFTSSSQISSSTSRARRSASHVLAAAICSSGGLVSSPSSSFVASSAAISATGRWSAKLKHYRLERTVSTPHSPEHQALITRPAFNSLD
jgi:hypothetical protein